MPDLDRQQKQEGFFKKELYRFIQSECNNYRGRKKKVTLKEKSK